MASNEQNRFFSHAEKYIKKVKDNEICPKRYYTRHTDPRNLTENQLYQDKRSVLNYRRKLKLELKNLNYNVYKLQYHINKYERFKKLNQTPPGN